MTDKTPRRNTSQKCCAVVVHFAVVDRTTEKIWHFMHFLRISIAQRNGRSKWNAGIGNSSQTFPNILVRNILFRRIINTVWLERETATSCSFTISVDKTKGIKWREGKEIRTKRGSKRGRRVFKEAKSSWWSRISGSYGVKTKWFT